MSGQNLQTFALASLPDWRERLTQSMRRESDGAVDIGVLDVAPVGLATLTQPLFDEIAELGTIDDYLYHTAALHGASPGFPVRHIRNLGSSLATMGRVSSRLPGAVARTTTILGGTVASQTLAVNTIYSLTGSWASQITLSLPGSAAVGDQIDLSNEANVNVGLPAVQVGSSFYAVPSSQAIRFTAIWNGSAWETLRQLL